MDRRDFLKMIGLGGMALTLPKPLSVFAAKARDLEQPPLHVGHTRFRNMEKFSVHDLALEISPDAFKTPEEYTDFIGHWFLHLNIRRDERSYLPLIQDRAEKYLVDPFFTRGNNEEHAWSVRGFIRKVRPGIISGASINLLQNDALDVWLVPTGEPKHPLPSSLRVSLFGPPKWNESVRWSNGNPLWPPGTVSVQDHIHQPLRAVRLERTRAIELGFASPSDPFEAL